MEVRTLVTFRTAKFNTSENKPYYINPCCFGDDVAEWFIEQLKASGATVDSKPGQEDFGWYVGFEYGRRSYDFVLGYNPDGYWMGLARTPEGIRGEPLWHAQKGNSAGRRECNSFSPRSSSDVSHIRWHHKHNFDAMKEELGTHTPSGNYSAKDQ